MKALADARPPYMIVTAMLVDVENTFSLDLKKAYEGALDECNFVRDTGLTGNNNLRASILPPAVVLLHGVAENKELYKYSHNMSPVVKLGVNI